MIKCQIDCWKQMELFKNNFDVYEKLYLLDENNFEKRPKKMTWKDEEKKEIDFEYDSMIFYVQEFQSIDSDLWNHITFSPLPMLEMMGGGRINSENVFEAAKRNQIMLPNNVLMDMKELAIEIDQCTNSINEMLKDGWKIIAVLPQHNQRRPDYILGKL